MSKPTTPSENDPQLVHLLGRLGELIRRARQTALRTVDTLQVQTCWHIGQHIVEFEQQGTVRATYGKKLIPNLANVLTRQYGKGFDERNLRYMRGFFEAFPIWNAVRSELSWTHYRILLRVEKTNSREWYMNECAIQNWTTRALERQIGTLSYERLLASQDRSAVKGEAAANLAHLTTSPREFVRDPVLLEFLGLPQCGPTPGK